MHTLEHAVSDKSLSNYDPNPGVCNYLLAFYLCIINVKKQQRHIFSLLYHHVAYKYVRYLLIKHYTGLDIAIHIFYYIQYISIHFLPN